MKALERRFLRTCCSRWSSVSTISGTRGEMETESSIPSAMVGRNVRSRVPASLRRSTGRRSIWSLPASILERSRIWLIKASSSWPLAWMVEAYCTSSPSRLPLVFSESRRARIKTLFSGVRSSCDMLARNSDLYRETRASCCALSSRSLVRFASSALDAFSSSSRCSVREVVEMVFSTTPIPSASFSRRTRWIGLKPGSEASSITPFTSPSNSAGTTSRLRGPASPTPERMRT